MDGNKYQREEGTVVSALKMAFSAIFRVTNQLVEWHRLPKWLAIANLAALRNDLRKHNLHDTDGDLTCSKPGVPFPTDPREYRYSRIADGTANDLTFKAMGCRGSRFGRNVPRNKTATPSDHCVLTPNPLLISERLMARSAFKPASSLNLLAAAWIQFQVHDWFAHEADSSSRIEVPKCGDWKEDTMSVHRTLRDRTPIAGDDPCYPAYANKNPQWWDGSQIYGESDQESQRLRTDQNGQQCPNGKLYITAEGLLPLDPVTGTTLTGFTSNAWLGIELMHTLFAKEHNAICDALVDGERSMSSDEIFRVARMINCAVMAKIHTIEWTPAILGHPAIKPGLDSNWMGFVGHWFGEENARRWAEFLPEFPGKEIALGIPLTEADHHGAPYSLTEEFTAVYRMHPLLPDEINIVSLNKPDESKCYQMEELIFTGSRQPLTDGANMADVIYSFGIASPGAITIKNYPNFLRKLTVPADDDIPQQRLIDLAAVDILRDRERGVPRYNEFLRLLRKKPVDSWKKLAGAYPELATELESIYGDLEKVDTLVGMLCEELPEGFGFSDTAFRIFILMASRRLKSDRFFTSDYKEHVYTRTGLRWIRDTGFREVLERNYEELRGVLRNVSDPFKPWNVSRDKGSALRMSASDS